MNLPPFDPLTMQSRHAQLTMFILFALVVVLLFGILLWLSVGSPQKQEAQIKETAQGHQEAVSAITSYVQSCVDQSSQESLALWVSQGGRLYASQGGSTADPGSGETILYQDKRVQYVVLPPIGRVGDLYFSDPPAYPWNGFPYTEAGNESSQWYFGYYGRTNLAPLYDDTRGSVQHDLELVLTKKVAKECVHFPSLGLNVETSPPTVKVQLAADARFVLDTESLTPESLIITTTYPLVLKDPVTKATTSLRTFTTNLHVRLTRLYYFVKNLAEKDVTIINFPITGAFPGGFFVTKKTRDADDIIIVRDEQSIVAGRPLEFLFARKDRSPALFTIPPLQKSACIGAVVSLQNKMQNQSQQYETSAQLRIKNPAGCAEASDIVIPLQALDPDEEQPTFGTNTNLPFTIDSAALAAQGTGHDVSLTVFAEDASGLRDWQTIHIPIVQSPQSLTQPATVMP